MSSKAVQAPRLKSWEQMTAEEQLYEAERQLAHERTRNQHLIEEREWLRSVVASFTDTRSE